MLSQFRSIFLIGMVALCASCAYKKKEGAAHLQADSRAIAAIVAQHADTLSIHRFLDLGLYNLAAATLEEHADRFSDSDRIRFVQRFLENGEFDKALNVSARINENAHRVELLHMHLIGALNRRDTLRSRSLLDSIRLLQPHKTSLAQQMDLQLLEAYHIHNTRDYLRAIRIGEEAVHSIRRHRLGSARLAKALHLLGNSYNDIVRDRVDLPIDKELCYNRGMACYAEEWELLLRDSSSSQTLRALNRITMVMLRRTSFPPPDSIEPLYRQALDHLLVSNEDGFIVTRNPVYTAIALTQLGEVFYHTDMAVKMDSLYATLDHLIHLRSLYQVYGNMSLDLLEYYPARTLEIRIQHEQEKRRAPDSPIRSLDLSNLSKYPNKFLKPLLAERFGAESATAVRNWILFHELRVFADHSRNRELASAIRQRLVAYRIPMEEIRTHKVPRIDSTALASLREMCRERDITVIDFQHIMRNPMLITRISAEGMRQEWLRAGQAIVRQDVLDLQEAITENDPACYERLALRIYRKLGLDEVRTPNLIICPDEFLERIPFDALVSSARGATLWSELDYLGDTKRIRLVPSLSSLLQESTGSLPLEVDLQASSRDQASLPYNRELGKHLAGLGILSPKARKDPGILHVIGHTYPSGEKSVEFRLDQDTLTIEDIDYTPRALAVFHGCRSGDGRILKTEGAISLTRTFLYNGTPAAIWSLWDADNRSSVQLFRRFYDHLAEGMNTTEALRQAKAGIRREIRHPEWASPFYWANFQLTGQELDFTN